MSGDQHNQADPLNLDEVELRAARADNFGSAIYTLELDVPALVAEVRRLRAERDSYRRSFLELHAATDEARW